MSWCDALPYTLVVRTKEPEFRVESVIANNAVNKSIFHPVTHSTKHAPKCPVVLRKCFVV